jgi:hypothetical protein
VMSAAGSAPSSTSVSSSASTDESNS